MMEDKPNFKKCKNCGAYGEQNRSCKYFSYDIYEEVRCNYFNVHKYSKKKKEQGK